MTGFFAYWAILASGYGAGLDAHRPEDVLRQSWRRDCIAKDARISSDVGENSLVASAKQSYRAHPLRRGSEIELRQVLITNRPPAQMYLVFSIDTDDDSSVVYVIRHGKIADRFMITSWESSSCSS